MAQQVVQSTCGLNTANIPTHSMQTKQLTKPVSAVADYPKASNVQNVKVCGRSTQQEHTSCVTCWHDTALQALL